MNKKLVKIIPVMLLIVMIAMAFVPVFAASSPSDLTPTQNDNFDTIGKNIIGIVKAIGTIISVLMLVILGIKYMLGSSEEKAEYKKTMIPYLIGAILIFAAPYIAGAIYNAVGSLNK